MNGVYKSIKSETSKFIESASLCLASFGILVCYLRRDVFLDVRYMEEKMGMRKGDKETEKPLHLVLYRLLLGCWLCECPTSELQHRRNRYMYLAPCHIFGMPDSWLTRNGRRVNSWQWFLFEYKLLVKGRTGVTVYRDTNYKSRIDNIWYDLMTLRFSQLPLRTTCG